MGRYARLLVSSVAGLLAVGCVSQDKYGAMKLAREAAEERAAQAARQAQTSQAEADLAKQNLDKVMSNSSNQQGLAGNLANQNAELRARLAVLEKQYEEALNRTAPVQVLPQPVNDALTQFAAANPTLVDFDSARGIVKFKSDLTFSTGSAEVRPEARQAIGRFAQILNSPAAASYELQVAGHTDNQRVANPDTIKRGHLDNWYLSSHRAIAVGQALQSEGVQSTRVAVVGYADQHPIGSNATEQGRAQNRRVEVLILPSTARAPQSETAGVSGQATGAGNALNKDLASPANGRRTSPANQEAGSGAERGPAFNK